MKKKEAESFIRNELKGINGLDDEDIKNLFSIITKEYYSRITKKILKNKIDEYSRNYIIKIENERTKQVIESSFESIQSSKKLDIPQNEKDYLLQIIFDANINKDTTINNETIEKTINYYIEKYLIIKKGFNNNKLFLSKNEKDNLMRILLTKNFDKTDEEIEGYIESYRIVKDYYIKENNQIKELVKKLNSSIVSEYTVSIVTLTFVIHRNILENTRIQKAIENAETKHPNKDLKEMIDAFISNHIKDVESILTLQFKSSISKLTVKHANYGDRIDKYNRDGKKNLNIQSDGNDLSDVLNYNLIYFNGCDAYTGKPLTYRTMDHIEALNLNGDNIISNLIPCDRNINSSKNDKELFDWWSQEGNGYNPYRLLKITVFMIKSNIIREYIKDNLHFNFKTHRGLSTSNKGSSIYGLALNYTEELKGTEYSDLYESLVPLLNVERQLNDYMDTTILKEVPFPKEEFKFDDSKTFLENSFKLLEKSKLEVDFTNIENIEIDNNKSSNQIKGENEVPNWLGLLQNFYEKTNYYERSKTRKKLSNDLINSQSQNKDKSNDKQL